MVIKGIGGDRYAGVPVAVLKDMVEIVDSQISLTLNDLNVETRKRLGSKAIYATPSMLRKALFYLVDDGLVVVSAGVVRRKRLMRTSLVRQVIADTDRRIRLRRKTVARKATSRKKTVGKKNSTTKPLSRPDPAPPRPVPKPRSYRGDSRDPHRVGIFYATNRQPDGKGGHSNSGVPSTLDRGRALVIFPPSHKPGHLDEPRFQMLATLQPNLYTRIDSLERLPRAKYHIALERELRAHTNSILVFVHGFNVSFAAALKRTAQIALDTNFPGTAIAFSWPSQAHWTRYTGDLQRINDSAQALGEFLNELRSRHPETIIHVVSHSMGAQIAAKGIQDHASTVGLAEVVLQAPDISTVDYPALATALTTACRRVTVYTSRHDKALTGSGVTSGFARVGLSATDALHAGVDAIDASTMGDGTWWQHDYVFRAPLAEDLREALDGMTQVRPKLEARHHAGTQYFVFRPRR